MTRGRRQANRAARPGRGWLRLWARDSAVVGGSQLAALVVTTALAVIVARYLGPSDFGIFASFLGLAQVVMLFTSLGAPTWLLRELSNAPAAEGAAAVRMLSCAFALTLALTALLTLGTLAVAILLDLDGDLALALCALQVYCGLLGSAAMLEVVFRAQRRLGHIVVATLLEKGVLVAVVGAAVALGGGIPAISAGYAIAGVVRVAYALGAINRRRLAVLPRPVARDAGIVLRGSLPFALGTAIPIAIVRLDVFLIGLFATAAAGYYAVADRVLLALLIIPAASATTLYPLLARERQPLRAAMRVAVVLGAIGAALAAVGIVLAPEAIPQVFGRQYADAVTAVQIDLAAAPLMFACSPLMAGLFSGGHERRVIPVMLACTLAGTSFVVAGYALHGLEGATAGYVLRYLALLVALILLAARLGSRRTVSTDRVEAAGDRRAVGSTASSTPPDPPPVSL